MNKFFEFIKKSPTPYQVTEALRAELLEAGYTELFEGESWNTEEGRGYFTVRHGTALIAFRAVASPSGIMLSVSHSDSPTFKIKGDSEHCAAYTKLFVEKYGGMIMYSWLDRPLGVAGRLVVRTEDGVRLVNVDTERAVATVPSISIHQNRTVNDGYKFNPAKDMLPIVGLGEGDSLLDLVAKKAGVGVKEIVSHDLYLYVTDAPTRVGLSDEFILSPRLDDLACVYACKEAFLSAKSADSMPVLAVFDSEEVGSATVSGADSTFLTDVLLRILGSERELVRLLSSSLAVSADNAHARHPNSPELSDAKNAPILGGGTVIKYNSQKRYATDALSAAIFTEICNKAGARVQSFCNRADMQGGSTVGAILNTRFAAPTVDIGLPQLAMHSAVETAAACDLYNIQKALTAFYESSLEVCGEQIKIK